MNLLKKAINSVYNGEMFIQPDLIPILNMGLINKEESSPDIGGIDKA